METNFSTEVKLRCGHPEACLTVSLLAEEQCDWCAEKIRHEETIKVLARIMWRSDYINNKQICNGCGLIWRGNTVFDKVVPPEPQHSEHVNCPIVSILDGNYFNESTDVVVLGFFRARKGIEHLVDDVCKVATVSAANNTKTDRKPLVEAGLKSLGFKNV